MRYFQSSRGFTYDHFLYHGWPLKILWRSLISWWSLSASSWSLRIYLITRVNQKLTFKRTLNLKEPFIVKVLVYYWLPAFVCRTSVSIFACFFLQVIRLFEQSWVVYNPERPGYQAYYDLDKLKQNDNIQDGTFTKSDNWCFYKGQEEFILFQAILHSSGMCIFTCMQQYLVPDMIPSD